MTSKTWAAMTRRRRAEKESLLRKWVGRFQAMPKGMLSPGDRAFVNAMDALLMEGRIEMGMLLGIALNIEQCGEIDGLIREAIEINGRLDSDGKLDPERN